MGYDIITVEFCASYFAQWRVASNSDPSVEYIVSLGGAEGAPDCTCEAIRKWKRQECRHISYVWKNACLWNPQWREGVDPIALKPFRYTRSEDHIAGSECPRCGGPTIPTRIAV